MSEDKKKQLARHDLLRLTLEMQFELETEHYGRLYIFSYSSTDEEKLFSKILKEGENCEPDSFTKTLIAMVAYPIDKVDDETKKPENPHFSEKDLDKLSEKELDQFCRLFIEHNTYLSKEPEIKSKSSKDGKNDVEARHEKPWVDKSDEDNYRQHLLKLFKEKKKDIDKSISRMKATDILNNNLFDNPFEDIFKNPLLDKIGSTHSALKDAEDRIKALEPLQDKLYNTGDYEPPFQTDHFPDLQRNIQEAHERPFKKIAERIDVLTEVEGKVVENLESISDNQDKLARSGWETKQLTWIIIGITLGTFFLSLLFSFYISNITSKINTKNIHSLESQLVDVNKNLQGMSENSLNAGENMQEILDELTQQQRAILGELKKLNSVSNGPE